MHDGLGGGGAKGRAHRLLSAVGGIAYLGLAAAGLIALGLTSLAIARYRRASHLDD